MRNKNQFLSALFFCTVLAGCKTVPMKVGGSNEGQWEARALIKDLEKSKSYIVNIDFNLIRNEVVRMDVTSTLGTSVATLVTTATETRYALYDSKQFFMGEPSINVMRPILAIPFNPNWLQNVLFEIPFVEKNWSCTLNAQGMLSMCLDALSQLKITWSESGPNQKRIEIEHSKATLQINIKKFQPKVESQQNLFVLESPKGFKNLRVK